MDQAKVTVNFGEGILQLEGPVQFVSHYLDLYLEALKELPRAHQAEVPAAEEEMRRLGHHFD
jgi:hypothetical protein